MPSMADDEEGVVDNWEDADTEDLERRMEERHKQLQPAKVTKIKTRLAANDSPPGPTQPTTQLPLKIQDSDRTEYVAPIKILKRKSDSSPSTNPPSTHSQASSTKQYKTLAEREADYASARARILGSGYRSDDTSSNSPPQSIAPSNVGKSLGAEGVKRQPKGPNGSKGFTKT